MSETKEQQQLELAAAFAPDPDELQYLERMSASKKERVQRSLGRMRHGLHAVAPITCNGPAACPFIAHCPIPSRQQKIDGSYGPDSDYPLMLPCVLESAYQQQRILDYQRYLEVDISNPVEMALVNELAILDLHKNRALMITSEGDRDGDGRDFLRQDRSFSEVADSQVENVSTSLHPAFEVLDRIERRRERLLERLLETRKARAEIDLKRGNVSEESNVLKELQAVRAALEAASQQAVVDPATLDLDD